MARQSATASARAILYQQWNALQYCFEMDSPGQQVLIESLGDVTVKNETQIEVKDYKDPLTDGHVNFWKTLRNWVDDSFDVDPYKNLVLLTTQEFGAKSILAEWNDASVKERIAILECIAKDFEGRRSKSNAGQQKPLSDVEQYQAYCLETARKKKLLRVCEKLCIAAKSLKTNQLFAHLKGSRASHIFSGKRDDYLNSLFGYISRADLDHDSSWAITYEDFSKKIQELTRSMGHGTIEFPSLKPEDYLNPDDVDAESYQTFQFVKKIDAIEYPEVIPQAISDYLNTSKIIREEFSKYEVSPDVYRKYQNEEIGAFRTFYRRKLNIGTQNIKDASQDFYNEVMWQPPRQISGFSQPTTDFKNGLLHSHLNEDANDKWRLEK